MKLVIFGDSISYGFKELNNCYTKLLKNDFDVSLNAKCGGTTFDILKMLEKNNVYKSLSKDDFIIVQIGINDASKNIDTNYHKVSLKYFKENILKIIKTLKTYTSNIILLGLTNINEDYTTNLDFTLENLKLEMKDIIRYDRIIKMTSKEENVHYIELKSKINPIFDITLDGVHLNQNGHLTIYQEIINYLKTTKIIK